MRSTVEDAIETTAIYVTSSAPEMHAAESKIGAEIGSVKSKNNTRKAITRSGTHPRWRQGILPRLEAGPMAS
jgi:hypothetical protein